MSDDNSNFEDIDNSDNDSVESFATAAAWERKSIKSAPLLPHELLSLQQKLKRIVVIQQTDQSYHRALSDIRDQAIISVLVEPSFYGRHCITSVMVIATANNTYVFDLKALGVIFRELSVLLEAEYPRKIMHYSHRICDLLFHQHKLRINGICDTFVAMCVARQDRCNCTLQDAIALIFELPLSELTCHEITSASESLRNFTARPLSRGQIQYLGKLAILQHKLHDTLIYGNICSDLQQMSDNFSCEFNKQKKSDEVALNMRPGSKSGFDCIDPYYKISTSID
ncbi:protein Exd1 homolog [Drosophila novamexicana]|uniref:protein Exd1 homolog n=1 Tax=Drosophila novamexicana TaxID=47314 RepID=UPI0011E58B16|nr:protein Exd1 homolog [Drosophila novamexicana]XP_030567715.1 protein Exd1 homolog [Drosophila novamexicana]